LDLDDVTADAGLSEPGKDLRKRYVLSFDRKVVLDMRLVPGELWSAGHRKSAGKEFQSIGAEYLKDRSRIDLLDVTAGRERVISLEDLVERAG